MVAVSSGARAWPSNPAWNGTLARSRFFDGISLLLPVGETFLVDTIAQWLAEAEADEDGISASVRTEAERFIREESAHQRVHDRYNEALISSLPGAVDVAARASRVTDGLQDLDLKTKVALAAAFEYLTALLSLEMLKRPYLLDASPTTQRRVWLWHAREELAHCHVAFDAVASLRVGRLHCALTFAAAAVWLAGDVLRLWFALCRCDAKAGAGRLRMCAQACRFALFGVPCLARVSWGALRYFLSGRPKLS